MEAGHLRPTAETVAARHRAVAERVVLGGRIAAAATVAGVDAAYDDGANLVAAAAVVLDADTLETIDEAATIGPVAAPYVAGALALREVPALLSALGRLNHQPDLIVVDGHGYAHPRRAGLACHLGVETGVPTIGCAKGPLVGSHAELGSDRGSRQPIVDGNERVGDVVRTRAGVKPVFVSPGSHIGFDDAAEWVLRLAVRYRLPETTRRADRLARATLAERSRRS